MKKFCIAIILFAQLAALGQTTISIPEPFGESIFESDIIQEVSFVPLKLEKPGMVTPDMEMKSDGSNFFILDHKMAQCVYRFNTNGQLEATIKDTKTGSSAMQKDVPVLSNPVKFSLDPFKKNIEIYNFENSKISRFNYNGVLQGQIAPEINPSDFVRDISGNYWIYTGWNNKETQFRLIKTDQNGKTTDRKMRLISKCMQTEGFAFYTTDKGICFWELLGNYTYIINGNNITETFKFDFGNNNLLENYHQLDPFDAFKILNETGYYTVKKYIENNNYAYFFLNYSTSQQKLMFHIIHRKEDGQTYILTENSSIAALDKAQYLTNDDELVFLVLPRKIRQLLSTGLDFVPAPFSSLDSEMADLRDPIILKIKLGIASTNDGQFDEYDDETSH